MGKMVKSSSVNVKSILEQAFPNKHVVSLLKHYQDALFKYQEQDWEGALTKTGKFLEAVLKSIAIHAKITLPASRHFNVKQTTIKLEQVVTLSDSLRLQIPKASVFIYDIACNRGARHDPDEVNPNKMDAAVAIPVSSWILSELVRFADKKANPDVSAALIESLMEKKHPLIENIEGRMYINCKGLSAKDVGILVLDAVYPKRMSQEMLIDSIKRHGFSKMNAAVAVTRLKNFVDEKEGKLMLRGLGRSEADSILSKVR